MEKKSDENDEVGARFNKDEVRKQLDRIDYLLGKRKWSEIERDANNRKRKRKRQEESADSGK